MSSSPFTLAELAFVGLYLSSLLVLGWLGHRARREDTLADFYLAGRGIGFLVLLLTLYATQYSGNTLFGFTGKTYRVGYTWTVCVHFMTAIVVVYMLFAVKLNRLARRRDYVTPSDFLQDRFGSRYLALVATLVMLVALGNYLLAQLKAMGEALRGFVPDHAEVAYVVGVLVLALIIVVYETLGGFRAVAWTDVIQGLVLMVGFLILLYVMFERFGSMGDATRELAETDPAKIRPPDANGSREWFSWVLMVGFGGALYPQAIQRLYAARSHITLRRTLAVMAFLPLTTTWIAVMFGVVAAAYVPDAPGDSVLTVVCREVQEQSLMGRWLVAVLMAGILAALMSTADSVLLCISSIVTKDLYGGWLAPTASQAALTRIGKISSWLVLAGMAVLAILLRDTTLVTLLKLKFELLAQLAPGFLLGIRWRGLRGGPVLLGLVAGVVLSVALVVCGLPQLWGIHAGLYGLLLNTAIACLGSLALGVQARRPDRAAA